RSKHWRRPGPRSVRTRRRWPSSCARSWPGFRRSRWHPEAVGRSRAAVLLLVGLSACGPTASRLPLERTAGTVPAPTTVETVPPPTVPAIAPVVPPTTAAVPPAPAAAVVSPKGLVLPVEGTDPAGYVVQTPCGNRAILGSGKPLSGATVVLDPGHGGDETGAVGPNGLRESVLNMAVVQQARTALERAGVSVITIRSTDVRVVLSTRSQLVEKLRPQAFVSVHHNSTPDGPRAGPGTETYYQFRSPSSKRLAGLVYEEVANALSAYKLDWEGNVDAGAKYRLNDRGGDYYHMLRETAGVP